MNSDILYKEKKCFVQNEQLDVIISNAVVEKETQYI